LILVLNLIFGKFKEVGCIDGNTSKRENMGFRDWFLKDPFAKKYVFGEFYCCQTAETRNLFWGMRSGGLFNRLKVQKVGFLATSKFVLSRD